MKLFLVFSTVLSVINGARILAVFPFPSISHQKVFAVIAEALAKRNHEVTVITTDPTGKNLPNLTEIDISIGYDIFKTIDVTKLGREFLSPLDIIDGLFQSFENALELEMETEAVKMLLKKAEDSFDLILTESHSPITYGFQHKFKAPMIAVSSLGALSVIESLFGNPIHPVLYPCLVAGQIAYSDTKSFWEKVDSLYFTVSEWLYYNFVAIPRADEIARKYFGSDMPSTQFFMKNTSMLLLNVNPVFSDRKPKSPNVIHFHNIYHYAFNEDIPKDLQEILDKGTNGTVYFSLGTNVRLSHLGQNLKETMMEALGSLPYTILCKWESEDYSEKPKNVILRKWFPQQSILAHPNVKAFVTQGGLQSSEEAIINAVPLVVIPFLADQPLNAKILTSRGMAETILPKQITKDVLRDTILKVAREEKYRIKARELRDIFLDQPQSGIDKVVWWCEYVIRHKGAKHLRSPGADIPLYEYFMLDILAVFLATLIVSYLFLKLVLRQLSLLFKGKQWKKKVQ